MSNNVARFDFRTVEGNDDEDAYTEIDYSSDGKYVLYKDYEELELAYRRLNDLLNEYKRNQR